MLKIIVVGYIITGVLLVVLAFMMNKFDLDNEFINIGTIAIMILATFISGFLTGKVFKQKKWLHGILVGLLYFVVLVVISMIFVKNGEISSNFATSLVICICSTTLGAMIG